MNATTTTKNRCQPVSFGKKCFRRKKERERNAETDRATQSKLAKHCEYFLLTRQLTRFNIRPIKFVSRILQVLSILTNCHLNNRKCLYFVYYSHFLSLSPSLSLSFSLCRDVFFCTKTNVRFSHCKII